MLEILREPAVLIFLFTIIGMIICSLKRTFEDNRNYIINSTEYIIKIRPKTLKYEKHYKHYFYYSAKTTRNKRIFLRKKKRDGKKLYFDIVDKIP